MHFEFLGWPTSYLLTFLVCGWFDMTLGMYIYNLITNCSCSLDTVAIFSNFSRQNPKQQNKSVILVRLWIGHFVFVEDATSDVSIDSFHYPTAILTAPVTHTSIWRHPQGEQSVWNHPFPSLLESAWKTHFSSSSQLEASSSCALMWPCCLRFPLGESVTVHRCVRGRVCDEEGGL